MAAALWLPIVVVYGVIAVACVGGFTWLSRDTRRVGAIEAPSLVVPPGGGQRVRPLFLAVDRNVIVVDGVLGEDVGVPVTFRFVVPQHGVLAAVVTAALRRWVAGAELVEVDWSRFDSPIPSIGLACDDTRVWLDVCSRRGPSATVPPGR